MTSVIEVAGMITAGSGGTLFCQAITGWFKSRGENHRTDREVDAKLEEHRDQLTFDLIRAAREEMSQLRAEVIELRPLMVHAAHLEEALDHLHALLHADGDIEYQANARRAKAFLRRMRPEIGDLRNKAQTHDSARRVKDVINKGNERLP